MPSAYLNAIATAVPDHDVHAKFISYCPKLFAGDKNIKLFERMVQRAQINHRYSFLKPDLDPAKLDTENFYQASQFPDTASRMRFYKKHAFTLAKKAVDQLNLEGLSHLIVTSCTGFYAPGLDFDIVQHYGLPSSTERTIVGFMGCYAALNALKLAKHIVRSDEEARVLIVNLELCTLHLKEHGTFEQMLSYLIFADGCAASIVSADPMGIKLESFASMLVPDSESHITWDIGELGFDMNLSGRVPGLISETLSSRLNDILRGDDSKEIDYWAIHPGGRSILDAVRDGASLDDKDLAVSREILRRYGNMSSATVMFVLKEMLENPGAGGKGCAMAFGPGLGVESMRFSVDAGHA